MQPGYGVLLRLQMLLTARFLSAGLCSNMKGMLDPEGCVTNGLIAVNAAMFAAQVASTGAVTQLGVKVFCL